MKSVLVGITLLVALSIAEQWHVLSYAGDATLMEVQFGDSLQGWATANHCLFRTTDRGRTWSVERDITSDTAFGGLAVIDSGHILVSYHRHHCPRYFWWWVWIDERERGVWSNRYINYEGPMIEGELLDACRFSVLDSMHLWHLGLRMYFPHSVAVRTRDGGLTWDYFRAPAPAYDASFTDSLAGWAVSDTVWKTSNAGDSWQALTSISGGRRIQMSDSLSGWVMTTSGLMQTTDGGDSWTTFVAETGLKAMRFCNPRHGVAVGMDGVILHTTDAGATWAHDTSESCLDLYAVWMVDSAHAWAAGESGVVLGMGDWAAPGVEEGKPPTNSITLARVWPIPCRGRLWVQCRGGTGSVVVYDGCGRPVTSVRSLLARVQELDLRRLPAGVYFVRALPSPQPGARFVLLR